jgi:hypothetical protein
MSRRDEIDELLSQGRLGGPARERILERVIHVVHPPARHRRLALAFSLATCAATAAVVIVVSGRHAAPDGELRPKGAPARTPPSIEALCGAETGVCHAGERLFFRADASPVRRWLVAYAERTDAAPPAERIWMFRDGPDEALEIPPSMAPSILRRSVELGHGMPPGQYRITFIVSNHAPTGAEPADTPAPVVRLTRTLVVQ